MPEALPLLDVSRLVWRAWKGIMPTGIDRTCLAYVGHFRERAHAVVQWGGVTSVLPHAMSRTLFDLLLEQRNDVKPALIGMTVRALATRLSTASLDQRVYLNVGHTGLDRPGHADWLARSGVRPIYFVHDLIPLTHPEYCRAGEPEKHLKRMVALLGRGAGVIGNSRDTISELGIFAGLQKTLTMPPALVAPLGADAAMSDEGETSVMPLPARPYFVMLGTIEGRKNHLLMLTIWAEMARRLGPACPQLIIVGRRGWECEQVVDMLERCQAIRGHVIELPRCGDTQLRAYLGGARALLLPSFVEGYGLPLVEALARGAPVIASDLGVFRELAGDIPDYLKPIDGQRWQDLIEDYARADSPSRAAQLERMIGWSPPLWSEHFALVDRWLEQFS